MNTFAIFNPTSSAVTVGANTVNAHSSANLTISQSDAASFVAAGCTLAEITPGTASPAQLRGFVSDYGNN